MQLLLVLMVISSGCSHKVVDSVEDLSPEHFNSTTLLHPVTTTTTTTNRTDDKASSASSWKIATSLADDGQDRKADNLTTSKERQAGHLSSSEETTPSKPDNASSSEFRASPQLGNFLGEDNFVVPTPTPIRQTYGPFSTAIKRPPSPGFFSPYKEERWLPFNKLPKEVLKQHWDPFRMETPLLTSAKHREEWKPSSIQDSNPTAETPVTSLPAGTLYHSAGSFKHRPDEFGMDFHGDLREIAVKRPPPWSGLLRILAALVPVGVIVSALTPSVLQIETTANNNVKANTNNIFRRADHLVSTAVGQSDTGDAFLGPTGPNLPASGGSHLFGANLSAKGGNLLGPNNLPAMSEHCRRRLLCELQADHNYHRTSARDCRRMRCEDPDALHAALRWLLLRPHSHPVHHAHAHVHHTYSYD